MDKAFIPGFSRSRKEISIVINLIDYLNVGAMIHLISVMYMQQYDISPIILRIPFLLCLHLHI